MMKKTNWHAQLRKQVLRDKEARAEYESFKLQLELAQKLKDIRQAKQMTQDDVAERMVTKKTVVARLEAAGGKNKHSPSLATLVRLADALECDLNVIITPRTKLPMDTHQKSL